MIRIYFRGVLQGVAAPVIICLCVLVNYSSNYYSSPTIVFYSVHVGEVQLRIFVCSLKVSTLCAFICIYCLFIWLCMCVITCYQVNMTTGYGSSTLKLCTEMTFLISYKADFGSCERGCSNAVLTAG